MHSNQRSMHSHTIHGSISNKSMEIQDNQNRMLDLYQQSHNCQQITTLTSVHIDQPISLNILTFLLFVDLLTEICSCSLLGWVLVICQVKMCWSAGVSNEILKSGMLLMPCSTYIMSSLYTAYKYTDSADLEPNDEADNMGEM